MNIPQTNSEIISLLVSLSSASLKTKNLVLHEPHRIIKTHGQIHLFISAPFGENKSTILDEIAEYHNTKVLTDVTYPALIGSVDTKTNTIIPAAVWECRKNFLLIDEFNTIDSSKVSKALLQILEKGKYGRKVAKSTQPLEIKDGKLSYIIKDGRIEVTTKVSAIITTMYSLGGKQSTTLKALMSRCVPIRYKLSDDELDDISEGKKLYKPFQKLLSKISKATKRFGKQEDFQIPKKEYMIIRNYVRNFRNTKRKLYDRRITQRDGTTRIENDASSLFLRTIGDCCRAYAVLHEHSFEVYELICSLKATRGIWRK